MEGNQNASRNQNINMSAGIFPAHALPYPGRGPSMHGRDGSHSFHRQFQLRSRIRAPFPEPYYKNRLFFTGSAVSGQAVIHRATGGNNA